MIACSPCCSLSFLTSNRPPARAERVWTVDSRTVDIGWQHPERFTRRRPHKFRHLSSGRTKFGQNWRRQKSSLATFSQLLHCCGKATGKAIPESQRDSRIHIDLLRIYHYLLSIKPSPCPITKNKAISPKGWSSNVLALLRRL